MQDHGVPPTPQNYTIWTTFVSGTNAELNESLQVHIDRGGPIDESMSDELYDRFFTFKRIQDAVMDTGGAMSRELGEESGSKIAEYPATKSSVPSGTRQPGSRAGG